MTGIIKTYLPLFKLRICALITFSAVVGLVSAPIEISAFKIVVLIVATMLAAAGASAFNHYFDTDIDSMMERTRARPAASGVIADTRVVLLFAALLSLASVLLSLKLLNYMVALHLFLGAFVYAIVYTVWLKRRSSSNIIIGGLAGSFAVLAGGASASPELCMTPVLLAVTMFFWTPSHFWSFAIVHREDYEKAGVPMLPNIIGDKKTSWFILLNTVLLVASSFVPTYLGYMGALYTVAAVIVGAYFIYMNILLVRDTTKELAWRNFKASMFYLGILFLAVIVDVAIA